jgi:8-amino-7-oxononanoate synthase
MAFEYIQQHLKAQQQNNLLRKQICIEHNDGRHISVAGTQYLNFSSNDYLGLNQHPQINKAMNEGVERFGLCSSGSSLVTGHHYAHQALEETICAWLNKPNCLLFSSGFAANSGLMNALGQPNTQLWLDKLSHASMIDGALASAGKVRRFQHNDITQLQRLLAGSKQKGVATDQLFFTEGVFSMDGDEAEIKQLAQLAKQEKAVFCVDDAHAIGIIGEHGEGSISKAPIDIVMATFGKAIATSGAFIACENNVYDYLVNFCRHYIYSTAMSPAIAWATKQAIELIQTETWRRDKIKQLTALLKNELMAGVKILPSTTSIQAIIIGEQDKALHISEQLKKRGIWLSAIRPPTVPRGTSRLRVTVCSNHKEQDIKYLAECINETLN